MRMTGEGERGREREMCCEAMKSGGGREGKEKALTTHSLAALYIQKTGPKMLDHEGKSLPGNRGYK